MFLQYLITTAVLVCLAGGSIGFALSWMNEQRLRNWENCRYLGAQKMFEHDFKDGRNFFDAALAEANELNDAGRVARSKRDLAMLDEYSRWVDKENAAYDVDHVPFVWPGGMEFARRVNRSESYQRWAPQLNLILKQKIIDAQNNPRQTIVVADGLYELAQYDSASQLYEKARKQTKENIVKISAIDRLARCCLADRKTETSRKLMREAIKLAEESKVGANTMLALQLHLAQSYVDRGEKVVNQDFEFPAVTGAQQFDWYVALVDGQRLIASGKQDPGFAQVQKAAKLAETKYGVNSSENLRCLLTMVEALVREGKLAEAKKLYKDVYCTVKNRRDKPQSAGLASMRDGVRYMWLKRWPIAIFMFESSIEWRNVEHNTPLAKARRLYLLSKCYKASGNREKSLEILKQARQYSTTDPNIRREETYKFDF